jgi:hypothetical protein
MKAIAPLLVRLLLGYYLATPLFLLVDLVWQAPLRVAFIQTDSTRFAYYGFCFLCGLVMWRWPEHGPLLGILESTVNFTLVALSILMPIWSAPDAIAAGGGLPDLGLARITNAMLSGTMLVAGFHARQSELMRSLGRSGAKDL